MERLNEFIKRGAAEVLLFTICCSRENERQRKAIKIGRENCVDLYVRDNVQSAVIIAT